MCLSCSQFTFSFHPAGQGPKQSVLLSHNNSGRFESRFVTVKIEESPSILLQGMSGSSLGVWVAHGEGKNFLHCVKLRRDARCSSGCNGCSDGVLVWCISSFAFFNIGRSGMVLMGVQVALPVI